MKQILIVFSALLLCACNHTDVIEEPPYTKVDSVVRFSIQDNAGNDLLEPGNKIFDVSNIKVYRKDMLYGRAEIDKSEKCIFIEKPMSNSPFNGYNVCHINPLPGGIRRTAKAEYIGRVFVEWKPDYIDTITCRFSFGQRWQQLTEVTINDYIWTVPNGEHANFKIILDKGSPQISIH